ncbi:hypothetical protein AAX21_07955 [Oenococcus oeni]|nr:hypothetical protein X301_07620 [Oenococcus oeni IOEB_S450]KMQ37339.1 hypothetical protein AAX21_07955 [Oenococcus oeni]KMQ40669.1 hypothetical protein AAX22_04340 [Oenococcus oeni]
MEKNYEPSKKKQFAGQPIIAWIFQILLMILALLIMNHFIVDNIIVIVAAGILVILTFVSLALNNHDR